MNAARHRYLRVPPAQGASNSQAHRAGEAGRRGNSYCLPRTGFWSGQTDGGDACPAAVCWKWPKWSILGDAYVTTIKNMKHKIFKKGRSTTTCYNVEEPAKQMKKSKARAAGSQGVGAPSWETSRTGTSRGTASSGEAVGGRGQRIRV